MDLRERFEDGAAVRQIVEIALAAGEGDENPVATTMAILAAAYTTGATALLMSGTPLAEVEAGVRTDCDLCLGLLQQAEADPNFPKVRQ